jgi:PAS domain-containing protein
MLDQITPENPEIRIENRFETTEGVRWTLWTNRGLAFDEHGTLTELQSAGIDITERKHAEQALEENQRRLQAVLDVLPLPLFIADADGRIHTSNPAADDLWGSTRLSEHPDSYGEDYKAWWPDTGKRVESHEWGLARALGGEVVTDQELDLVNANRQRRTILNYARPIRNATGGIDGAVAVNVDITARKRAEEALRESEQRLRLALRGGSAGVWMLDVSKGEMYWSDEFMPLYGYDQSKPRAYQTWIASVHPDDR